MTLSTTVDVSDSLDEARTRLEKTARALNGAWAAALCSMASLVVASLALLLVAISMRPVYVVIWSVLLTACGYNLTRFWPRRHRPTGQLLSKQEVAALRAQIDPDGLIAWPEVVRLVPSAELELAEGELVLGMPLLACMDRAELRDLLLVAAMQAAVEDELSIRWALRVAHGEIGRPLVSRRTHLTWVTLRLTDTLRRRAAQLEADLGNWAGACERAAVASSRRTAAVIEARDQVADAWALVSSEWLRPAFQRGCRHVAPFTGLRHFVEGADAAGWLKQRRPWWPPDGVIASIVSDHEEGVALELAKRGDQLRPITWEEHPVEVSVPQWRGVVTEALDVARRSSYDPAVTLESVLTLLETDADRLHADSAVSSTLTAAVGIAAIDSALFRPSWSWPEGTSLQAVDDGWTLPLESIVTDVIRMARDGDGIDKAYAELREALEVLRIDVEEPLWLDHDPTVRPERPVGSFAAVQGFAPRVAVVTDRALHLFRDVQWRPVGNPERSAAPRDVSVELRRRMLAVWQGDTTEQVLTLAAADVRKARLGPAIGGLWWRLTLTCEEGTVVLRGRGDGFEEEAEVREWLGDRVEPVWLHSRPAVRAARNAIGLAGVTVGSFALLWALLLTFRHPAGMPAVLPPVFALGGLGALLVALVPDWALQLKRRAGQARLRLSESGR
jgi:hypothetical protein